MRPAKKRFYLRVLTPIVVGFALAGCGLQGDLKRADPLFGNPPLDGPTDPRVIRQQEEAARIAAEEQAAADAAARAAESQAIRDAAEAEVEADN